MRVPLSRPDITDLERAAVLEVLGGSELSLGPRLPAFEQRLAQVAGTTEAVAVNSGTSALHLCVRACGIGEGSEVVTTPFSFVASANCILFERGIPVFVDVDPSTYNINLDLVERAITTRTAALLPVHVFGRPCSMRRIRDIAARRGLSVIEDACEAIGASIDGLPVGSWGDCGVFAFYPNKQVTTGEGGAIVTSSARIAADCRSMRNQGRGDCGSWLQHERLGYNYRLSDINCALGSGQLARLPEMLAARARAAQIYTELLNRCVPWVATPAPAAEGVTISWFVYVVRLTEEFSREDRDRIMAGMKAAGIGVSNYFTPIHLQPFYRRRFGFASGDFPIAEAVAARTIALPFHSRISESEIHSVVRQLSREILTLRRSRQVPGSMNQRRTDAVPSQPAHTAA